jgi:O-antigen biosynthesis protein
MRTAWHLLPPGMRAAVIRSAPPWLIERLDQSGSYGLVIARRYQSWIDAFDTLTDDDRQAIRAHIAQWLHPPLISVLMPVYNPDPRHLHAAIGSLVDQLYPHWELCIADDASTNPDVAAVLQQARAADSRIRLICRRENGNISAASNSALELATGDFTALVDHDDLLAPQALYEVAAVLAAHPDTDIVFSDEDQIDHSGRRSLPYFKPGWNPELMLQHNLISHFAAYRSELVRRVDGFRIGLEGSQDYDLALRILAHSAGGRIRHVPTVLYHWRRKSRLRSFSETDPERCVTSARRALRDYLTSIDTDGVVVPAPALPQWSRILYPIPDPPPLVSVIIPAGARPDRLARCIDGVLQRTEYGNLEVIVVDSDSEAPLQRLSGDQRVRVVRNPGPSNEAVISNRGVAEARGELVLLLSNNIEVIRPDWLREMVSHAIRREIGTVGAKLLYSDGSVQHAGMTVGAGEIAAHQFRSCDGTAPGYCGHLQLVRNVTAVSGTCLMVRRTAFLDTGGLNENELAAVFGDVDFCLRLAENGLRTVWTPYAKLCYYQPTSREHDTKPKMQTQLELASAYMRRRWGDVLAADPFWNPNLSLDDPRGALAFPPRRIKPWLSGPCRANTAPPVM